MYLAQTQFKYIESRETGQLLVVPCVWQATTGRSLQCHCADFFSMGLELVQHMLFREDGRSKREA